MNSFRRRKSSTRVTGCERLEPRHCLAAGLAMQGPVDVLFEGERAEFTLRLAARSARAETVFVTTSPGTATYGVDYMAPARQQILFAPGQTVQTFSIQTLQEAVPRAEGIETFFVTATPANPGLAGPLTTAVRIADYRPKPTISVADISVVEGDAGTTAATFTIRLSAPYAKRVSVAYATRDGSATVADSDYVATAGSLEFLAGETTKTVTVNVTGDRKLEANETFSLVLSAPVNADLGRATGVCTIVNDERDAPGFQVALKFLDSASGPVPQSVRTVAEQAVNRWAKIITGDLASFTENGIFIDDFEMSIQMGLLGGAPTDGTNNTLANARPTAFRDNGAGLPYAGITGLDPADIGNPAVLLDTIAHEMGHAFGFVPSATVFNRWIVGNTFVGANALREYNSIFATTAVGVPMQTGGAHWDETIFGNELMSPTTYGAPEYISRITIGALQDMGYTVTYAAAEPYVRPRTLAPQVAASTGVATVSAFATTSTPTAKPSQPAAQPKPQVVTATPAVKPAAQPQKPAQTATQPTTRPAAPPRPKTVAAVSSVGIDAAFSTLGRMS